MMITNFLPPAEDALNDNTPPAEVSRVSKSYISKEKRWVVPLCHSHH